MHLCQVWVESAIAVPTRTTKAFLGDSETLHGGSMGEPITQPGYVYELGDIFTDALARIGKCAVPEYLVFNNMEIGARTMANYIWHAFVIDPDPLGMR